MPLPAMFERYKHFSAEIIGHDVCGLNSHAPGFEEKTLAICALYGQALRLYQEGRLVIRTDEKTGMQIVQRNYPTQLAQPGQPEKREQEYLRHGTRALLASLSPTRCQQRHGRVRLAPCPNVLNVPLIPLDHTSVW